MNEGILELEAVVLAFKNILIETFLGPKNCFHGVNRVVQMGAPDGHGSAAR
jgi:hypothetical protein